MFNTILVPTDGSPLSDKAIGTAVEFAREHGSKLIMMSVAEPYMFSALDNSYNSADAALYEEKTQQKAMQHIEKAIDAAQAIHVSCDTYVALSFSPYEEIIKAANKFKCDVIFMASHGRKGLNKLFLGSETQKVLAHSSIPVLVLREEK